MAWLFLFRLRLDLDFLIPDVINLVRPQGFYPDDYIVYLLVCQLAVPCRHSSVGTAYPNHSFQRFRRVVPRMSATVQRRRRIPPVRSRISPSGCSLPIRAMAACAIFSVNRLASLDFFRVKLAGRQIFWRLCRCSGRCCRFHGGCSGFCGEWSRGRPGWRGRNSRRLRGWC